MAVMKFCKFSKIGEYPVIRMLQPDDCQIFFEGSNSNILDVKENCTVHKWMILDLGAQPLSKESPNKLVGIVASRIYAILHPLDDYKKNQF